MGITLPSLTPAQESLFLTLAGRALDSRLPHPFLGDPLAAGVIESLRYDISHFRLTSKVFDQRTMTFDIAVRAKKLDEVVRRFIARHPDAVVLDLGAGLDSRRLRVEPPPTVDWYDVDHPEVVDLREQVLPPRARGTSIGADLTGAHWLAGIPTDRPAVCVADGVIAFLPHDGLVSLLNRLVGHVPRGELAFNAYTRFHVRAAERFDPLLAEGVVNPGFGPHDPERWAPGMTLAEEIFLTRVPEIAGLSPAMRTWYRLSGLSAGFSRFGTVVNRYRFSGGSAHSDG